MNRRHQMTEKHQCGLGLSLLLSIGLAPSHGTRDAVCLVLASLCAFGRSGKAPCRCRANACPVIAVRRCPVRRRVCLRPTGGGAAGTEADTLGARSVRNPHDKRPPRRLRLSTPRRLLFPPPFTIRPRSPACSRRIGTGARPPVRGAAVELLWKCRCAAGA
jgi:hypothetical protein